MKYLVTIFDWRGDFADLGPDEDNRANLIWFATPMTIAISYLQQINKGLWSWLIDVSVIDQPMVEWI